MLKNSQPFAGTRSAEFLAIVVANYIWIVEAVYSVPFAEHLASLYLRSKSDPNWQAVAFSSISQFC